MDIQQMLKEELGVDQRRFNLSVNAVNNGYSLATSIVVSAIKAKLGMYHDGKEIKGTVADISASLVAMARFLAKEIDKDFQESLIRATDVKRANESIVPRTS